MIFDIVLWGGLIVALAVSFKQVDIDNLPRLFNGSSTAGEMAGALFNPDFTRVDFFIKKMLETVMIALWGTFLALFLAIPLAFMAARNVAPAWLVWPVRRVMDLMRSVPDLVIGLIFVIIVGLGPLPGVLALALNTGGVLAKLFSEAVESIDKGPVEGVRATGAQPLHEIRWGILPQVAPLWTSFALYRFESNARAATVLGLIGAGGIGSTLIDAFNSYNYREVSAIAIIVVVTVTLIDMLSQVMRKRLL
ncbi:MAG TPA: phosphonate ABC transporter, permease protein PhnE [Brevundimonas sp.]|uniref:phosphonate ABC transporter, permease protein PhnE n=1 Tax=Brevundimonas sp. TaxID=1871086 RepID=UPI002B525AF7|nr:phosphonate ABC transporter, permease protein PhnE [Brevundimonas sp.]HRH20545.1 phosphonate ABC transporter, permease protein PhnE [Brevundimonas sp.]